ncbi:low affinity immunoglobulin epsilon Fc receptor [Mytilus galloprovincialis]|uniref:Low affinity immunoglobulin epsilon Fc receptor n=1 Tax=Mytilus galloprovincialis TaxID=29158 RepID=A0A8B6CVT0_MYTGA|nr:low affinity immunoglobulin epsilon Fc receptor [Mytilus galloprovincialis]
MPYKASSECPLGWYHYGNSCFFFSHEAFDWFVSQSSCRAHNARLAEIETKAQSDILKNLAKTSGPGQSYWLGGRDDVIEGVWMWASTDKAFNYTDWSPGQPDNGGGNENCLPMHAGYGLKWNDKQCKTAYRFICEKEYSSDGSEIIG